MSTHIHSWHGVGLYRKWFLSRRWFMVLACNCGAVTRAELKP